MVFTRWLSPHSNFELALIFILHLMFLSFVPAVLSVQNVDEQHQVTQLRTNGLMALPCAHNVERIGTWTTIALYVINVIQTRILIPKWCSVFTAITGSTLLVRYCQFLVFLISIDFFCVTHFIFYLFENEKQCNSKYCQATTSIYWILNIEVQILVIFKFIYFIIFYVIQ